MVILWKEREKAQHQALALSINDTFSLADSSWTQTFFHFGLKLSVPLIASERGHKEGKLGFYLNRCMNCSDSHPDTPLLFLRLSAVFQREAFNLFKLWSPRAELSSSVCLCPSVCLYIFPSCHTQSFQVCVHAVELTEKAHCLPK